MQTGWRKATMAAVSSHRVRMCQSQRWNFDVTIAGMALLLTGQGLMGLALLLAVVPAVPTALTRLSVVIEGGLP